MIPKDQILYTLIEAQKDLPVRQDRSNKSDHGRCGIIAGSDGMAGALVLCSRSAYRLGAGYVHLFSDLTPQFSIKNPEILLHPLSTKEIQTHPMSAWAIGPGLGVSQNVHEILVSLKSQNSPVVVDADAWNACVKYDLWPLPKNWVATPYSGELSRLLKVSAKEIDSHREESAIEAQKITSGTLVLKGLYTLITIDKRQSLITSGNSSLAKAGTGDVLIGMIAGLCAQGLDPEKSACLSAFIHGWMADQWIRTRDPISLMASDLIRVIPKSIRLFRQRA